MSVKYPPPGSCCFTWMNNLRKRDNLASEFHKKGHSFQKSHEMADLYLYTEEGIPWNAEMTSTVSLVENLSLENTQLKLKLKELEHKLQELGRNPDLF